MTAAVVAVGLFLGAATQRLTGLGFGLVATPWLVFALGARDTVGLLLLTGTAVAGVAAWQVRASVEWGRVGRLAVFGLIGAAVGTWALVVLPSRLVELVIGILVLLGLVGAILTPRGRVVPRPWHTRIAGLGSGLATGLAALGGPPLVIYQRLTDWDPVRFAATIQPVFVLVAVPLLVLRTAVGESLIPQASPLLLAVALLTVVAGVFCGGRLSGWVRPEAVAKAILALAFAGAALTIVRAAVGPT